MKQIYLLCSVIFVAISSCTTVQFETSQPKGVPELTSFPVEITGKYTGKNKDTLFIYDKAIQYSESTVLGSGKINELNQNELVLKKWNEYFILSFKDSLSWQVFTFKKRGNNLQVYYINFDKKNEEDLINKIKTITKVTEIKDSEGKIQQYLINPSPEEFKLLFDKKVFSKVFEFKKVK
jgi:hypothetical protein